MKKTRKLALWMMTAITAVMLSGAAYAKSYVPVKGTKYEYVNGTWKKTDETMSASYSRDGKVKKVTITGKNGSTVRKYAWKGNNLKKETYKDSYSWTDGGEKGSEDTTCTAEYTIQNKRPKKTTYSRTYKNTASATWKTSSTMSYTWKGNKANVKVSGKTQGQSFSYTQTVKTKSGRRTYNKEDNATTTYKYRSGLLKETTYKGDGYTLAYKYNRYGYVTEWTEKGTNNGKKYTRKNTYRWTLDGKKRPKSVVVTEESTAWTSSYKFKYKFTKYKEVSKIRNCDAFGLPVWLGVENRYELYSNP